MRWLGWEKLILSRPGAAFVVGVHLFPLAPLLKYSLLYVVAAFVSILALIAVPLAHSQALTVPLPSVQDISTKPMPDVEWHFTTRELCTLIDQVEGLDVLTVSPGPAVAHPADWARVAYKGGSDFGVLNLTYWLKIKEGATYCVSATQNQADAIDEGQFFGFVSALLGVLP